MKKAFLPGFQVAGRLRTDGQGPKLLLGRNNLRAQTVINTTALSDLTGPPTPMKGPVIPSEKSTFRTVGEVVDGLGLDATSQRAYQEKLRQWSQAANPLEFRRSLYSGLRSFAPTDFPLRSELGRRSMAFYRSAAGDRFSRTFGREGDRLVVQKAFGAPQAPQQQQRLSGGGSPEAQHRGAQIGEIRDWQGGKYQKVSQGHWEPVVEGKPKKQIGAQAPEPAAQGSAQFHQAQQNLHLQEALAAAQLAAEAKETEKVEAPTAEQLQAMSLDDLMAHALAQHGEEAVKAAAQKAVQGVASKLDSTMQAKAAEVAEQPDVAAAGKKAAAGLSNQSTAQDIRQATERAAADPQLQKAAKAELGKMEGELVDQVADGIEEAVPGKKPSKFRAVMRAIVKGGAGSFVFGFLDNFIMYCAGASIDKHIMSLGLGAAATAGVGNAISDGVGQAASNYVERGLDKIGLGEAETSGVLSEKAESRIKSVASVAGVFVGALAGMVPMLFGVSFGKSERRRLHGPRLLLKADQLDLFAPKPKTIKEPDKAPDPGRNPEDREIPKRTPVTAKAPTKKVKPSKAHPKVAGGPFVGPRGGLWADPQHTIPWTKTGGPRGGAKRYAKEAKEAKAPVVEGPVPPKEVKQLQDSVSVSTTDIDTADQLRDRLMEMIPKGKRGSVVNRIHIEKVKDWDRVERSGKPAIPAHTEWKIEIDHEAAIPGHTLVSHIDDGVVTNIHDQKRITEDDYKRAASQACDVCKTKRPRRKAYIVERDKDGARIVVGGECAKDFRGANLGSVALEMDQIADLFRELDGIGEDEFFSEGGGGKALYEPMDVVAAAWAASKYEGYLKGEGGTRDRASTFLFGKKLTAEDQKRLKEAKAEIQKDWPKIVEWVNETFENDRKRGRFNDFFASLKALVERSTVDFKAIGRLAWVAAGYYNVQAKKKIEAAAGKKDPIAYEGPSKPHDLPGTWDIVRVQEKDDPYSRYGGTYFSVVAVNPETGERIWFRQSQEPWEEGTKGVKLRGKVKGKSDDGKMTFMSHMKEQPTKKEKAEKKKTATTAKAALAAEKKRMAEPGYWRMVRDDGVSDALSVQGYGKAHDAFKASLDAAIREKDPDALAFIEEWSTYGSKPGSLEQLKREKILGKVRHKGAYAVDPGLAFVPSLEAQELFKTLKEAKAEAAGERAPRAYSWDAPDPDKIAKLIEQWPAFSDELVKVTVRNQKRAELGRQASDAESAARKEYEEANEAIGNVRREGRYSVRIVDEAKSPIPKKGHPEDFGFNLTGIRGATPYSQKDDLVIDPTWRFELGSVRALRRSMAKVEGAIRERAEDTAAARVPEQDAERKKLHEASNAPYRYMAYPYISREQQQRRRMGVYEAFRGVRSLLDGVPSFGEGVKEAREKIVSAIESIRERGKEWREKSEEAKGQAGLGKYSVEHLADAELAEWAAEQLEDFLKTFDEHKPKGEAKKSWDAELDRLRPRLMMRPRVGPLELLWMAEEVPDELHTRPMRVPPGWGNTRELIKALGQIFRSKLAKGKSASWRRLHNLRQLREKLSFLGRHYFDVDMLDEWAPAFDSPEALIEAANKVAEIGQAGALERDRLQREGEKPKNPEKWRGEAQPGPRTSEQAETAAGEIKPKPKLMVPKKPAGAGWQPIPGSKHGGFRRPVGGGKVRQWEYWYPQGGKQLGMLGHPDAAVTGPKKPSGQKKPKAKQLELFARALASGDLVKGAGHKYTKRVPAPNPPPKYRYFYGTPKRRGITESEDIQQGAKFKVEHGGQLGHFEIRGHDKESGTVTVRHDESGRTVNLKEKDLHRMIAGHHGRKTKRTAEERAARHREKQEARAMKLRVQPTQPRLPGTEAKPEFPEPKEPVKPAKKLPRASLDDLGKGGFDDIVGFSMDADELEAQAETMRSPDREFAIIPQAKGFVLASKAKETTKGPTAVGDKTEVLLRGTGRGIQELSAEWAVVEADTLIASHDAHGFTQRDDYPVGVQERPYHRDRSEQEKVDAIARDMRPAMVANSNPDAINGAPIVTEQGVVLGGNGRTMAMQRAYAQYPESADKLREHLARHARAFGVSSAQVAGMKNPVLVRRVKAEGKDEQTRLGRRMNEALTQGLDPRAAEVAVSKFVTQEVVDDLTHRMPADQPLKTFLSGPASREFVKTLERAGIIDERNRNQFVNAETGLLNEDGRDRVSRVMAARLIPDSDLLDSMDQSWRENLAQAVPYFLQAESAGWDLRPHLVAAVQADADMQKRGLKRNDKDRKVYLAQLGLLDKDKRTPEARALLQVLHEHGRKARGLPGGFKQVALEADRQKFDHGDQGSMFARPKVSVVESLSDAFKLEGEALAASMGARAALGAFMGRDDLRKAEVGTEGLGRYLMHAVLWELDNLMRGELAAVAGGAQRIDGPRVLQKLRKFIKDQAKLDKEFARALGAHPLDDATLRGLVQAAAKSRVTDIVKSLARSALAKSLQIQ